MIRTLSPDALRATCDVAAFSFETTADLPPPEGVIGQARALDAAAFALAVKAPGYNVFVVGPPATGKASTMRAVITRTAQSDPTPPDDCYVHNFDDPYRPRVLELPPSRGRELRDLLARTSGALEARLTRTFESEEFARQSKGLSDELGQREKALMRRLELAARDEGFSVSWTNGGLTVALSPDGKPIDEAHFNALPQAEREHIEARAKTLEAQAEPVMRELRQMQREAQSARERFVEEAAQAVARELLAPVRERFATLPAVLAYLDAVERDIVGNAFHFFEPQAEDEEDEDDAEEDDRAQIRSEERTERLLDRYRVNLFVDRDADKGAPVVVEPNPTYRNLFGRIEHRVHLGTLVTDFTLVKAGALHRANGGYLLLEAKDLVADPFAWDALKKALKSGRIRMEEPLEELHMLSAASLSPEEIPLSLKIVLMGTPDLYHLLYELDEDFRELFKVKADFDETLPRTPEMEQQFARFAAGACREQGLPHLTAAAVARLVEQSARLAEHQRRLSARFGDLVDLVREAAFCAARRGVNSRVDAEDVDRAIAQKAWRSNLVEEQLARMTIEGELLITTRGAATGQVNGLEVFQIGDHAFGRPFRITARARPGKPGVLDVEREAGLGGAIHSKGVLILGGYLAGRYAADLPLAMSATLVAEQSYDVVDGDSASCAELCALLSTLSGISFDQSLAVTGAINQAGEVQPVGGINEKIEGFFDLCKARGLTGSEGVLIPAANSAHLMLRPDVVDAVRAGSFRVVAIATVDEALALLSGRPAGDREADGRFTPGTVNAAVEARLEAFAHAVAPRS